MIPALQIAVKLALIDHPFKLKMVAGKRWSLSENLLAKTAKPREMPFGIWTWGIKELLLYGVHIPSQEGALLRE